ncbi:TldD/PmbA family protein [Candidatus Woesearchaeota archaeon]|nr:TldD/PmbA family protein [Candidatus Woesearchaeota archaeon]
MKKAKAVAAVVKNESVGREEIAAYLVKQLKKKGADDVVVSAATEEAAQLKFSNNTISTTQSWHSEKINVFMAIDRKLVGTSIRSLGKPAVDDAVQKILKFAAAAVPNKEYMGIAEGPFNYREVPETYDEAIVELGEAAVDILNGAISVARGNGAARTAGIFETTVSNSYLLTSNGVEAEDKGTKAYFSLRAFVDKYASGHHICNSRVLRKFTPEASAERAATIAKQAVNPKAGTPGNYDIIFSPLPFANILESIGKAASIFNVESKLSCFAGKLGKKVGSENVTLVDDGTMPNGFDSAKFDEEGVPTQRNAIIENGVLRKYLHNTSTARRHKTKTTANAGLVTPLPFNLIFQNGNFNKEEMLRQVKRGLIVTNVWYTRFQNYESGDFSTIPRDGMFLVENGRVVGPVKELRISDNLLRMLQNTAAVGKDAEPVFGWEVEIPTITPAVLVKGVKVTKSVE